MRILKQSIFAAIFAAITPVVSIAATVGQFASDVWWVPNNGQSDDKTNALGADFTSFLELGLSDNLTSNPGFAVFKFDKDFKSDILTIYNKTNANCDGFPSNLVCTNRSEVAKVLVGTQSGFDFSLAQTVANRDVAYNQILANFTDVGSVGNRASQPPTGAALPIIGTGNWTYVALIDSSYSDVYPFSGAGFAVSAISTSPVPLPATAPLLAGALGLIVWRKRRGSKAA